MKLNDVREFNAKYLEDEFFVKNLKESDGKTPVELAKELDLCHTCTCL